MMDCPQGAIGTMVDRQMKLRRTGHDRVGAVCAVTDEQGLGPFFLQRHNPLDLSRTVAGIVAFADARFDFMGLLAKATPLRPTPWKPLFPGALFIGAAGTDEKADFFKPWQERFCAMMPPVVLTMGASRLVRLPMKGPPMMSSPYSLPRPPAFPGHR